MLSKEAIVAAIEDILASDETVIAAYLFGSHARQRAHSLSDVDVAVLLVAELDSSQRFARVLEIGSALEERLPGAVDVVDLRQAPPLLRFRIIQTGQLVVERDRTARCLFQMRSMNTYYDARRYLRQQQSAAVRRIQQEGLGRGYRGDRDALAEARRLRATFAAASAHNPG